MSRFNLKGSTSLRIVTGLVAAVAISAGVMAMMAKPPTATINAVYDDVTSTQNQFIPDQHAVRFDLTNLDSTKTYKLHITDNNFATDGWSSSGRGNADGSTSNDASGFSSINKDSASFTGVTSKTFYILTDRMSVAPQTPTIQLKENGSTVDTYTSGTVAISLQSNLDPVLTASGTASVRTVTFTLLGAKASTGYSVTYSGSKWSSMGTVPNVDNPTFDGVAIQHITASPTTVSVQNSGSATVGSYDETMLDQ